MTTTSDENTITRVVAFRDARWKTKWIVIGLAVLLLVRSRGFRHKSPLPLPDLCFRS